MTGSVALLRSVWRRLHPLDRWLIVATVGVALGLKAFASTASPEELGWILRPTAWLVGMLTGTAPVFEAGVGWVSHDLMLAITPACSGVNFLVILFGAGALSFAPVQRSARDKLVVFGACAAIAYAVTLAINALRIGFALLLRDASFDGGWLTPERVHHLEGIAVYLAGLCVVFLIARSVRWARVEER